MTKGILVNKPVQKQWSVVKWTRNSTRNLKFLPQIKTLGMIAHSANNLVRNDLLTK
jgi:hypothetical protein